MVQFFCLTVYMHTHKQAGIGIIMYINCIMLSLQRSRREYISMDFSTYLVGGTCWFYSAGTSELFDIARRKLSS